VDAASAERGERANRELQADRHSDPRFLANSFRLSLQAAALNRRVRRRQAVVPLPPTPGERGRPADWATAANDGPHRRGFFNRRRDRDPLGEGGACSWRTRWIKGAAAGITRGRRVIVRRAARGPPLDHFLAVRRAVLPRPPAPSPGGVAHLVGSRRDGDQRGGIFPGGRGKARHGDTRNQLPGTGQSRHLLWEWV
jgi:hypothetical protein